MGTEKIVMIIKLANFHYMNISENWQETLELKPSLNKAEDCAVNLQLFSGFFFFFFITRIKSYKFKTFRKMFFWKICTSYRTAPSVMWQLFSDFLIFCNLFYELLCAWNNSKLWETREISVILHEATVDN